MEVPRAGAWENVQVDDHIRFDGNGYRVIAINDQWATIEPDGASGTRFENPFAFRDNMIEKAMRQSDQKVTSLAELIWRERDG